MLLNLYSTSDDTRKVDKSLTAVKDITATPSENVTMLSPAFIVEYDSTILTANYCYIPEFARYYYITNITLLRGNRLQLNCAVDVLKTYADDLKNCIAVVIRNEGIGKPSMLPDNQLPINPNKKELLTKTVDFKIDTTNKNLYLVQIKSSPYREIIT